MIKTLQSFTQEIFGHLGQFGVVQVTSRQIWCPSWEELHVMSFSTNDDTNVKMFNLYLPKNYILLITYPCHSSVCSEEVNHIGDKCLFNIHSILHNKDQPLHVMADQGFHFSCTNRLICVSVVPPTQRGERPVKRRSTGNEESEVTASHTGIVFLRVIKRLI